MELLTKLVPKLDFVVSPRGFGFKAIIEEHRRFTFEKIQDGYLIEAFDREFLISIERPRSIDKHGKKSKGIHSQETD